MIYSIKANVYAKKLGPMFGRTTRTTIEAKDDIELMLYLHEIIV